MSADAGRVEDGSTPDEDLRARLRDVLIVGALLGLVSMLHALTPGAQFATTAYHDLFRRLYYVPILYAGFRFGARGGLVTSVAAVLLFAPHAVGALGGFTGPSIDNLSEMVMYVIAGGLFGYLRDTEARRTRDLVDVSRRLEDAYRVLEERAMQLISIQDYTQAILRSVTSGVVTLGPEGSVATANAAAERILGMNEGEMVARSLRALLKDDGGLAADVGRVLAGRSPRTMRDLKLVTRDGKTVHAQAAVSRMRDVGGRKLGAVVTIEDVSEVKMLTDQLIRADRLAAMGELTAGVAHEVRNPLGIIKASVQLMEDSDCSRERVREAAEVIKHEIDRLDRVIKALLDFGRPAAPTLRPVDLPTLAEDVVLFTRRFASHGGVEIVSECQDAPPQVMVDPEQLKQVFVNLISNAVQAMSDGGGTLTVSCGAEDDFAFVRFTDTGPGMDLETMRKVFDPFFSTRDDGTGLGLTIVHRIVDEHGGHIEITSDLGGGTAFTVYLPALG
ncbi:MAG TPA: ATP-binding protein [Coriobacteriia bacterium]